MHGRASHCRGRRDVLAHRARGRALADVLNPSPLADYPLFRVGDAIFVGVNDVFVALALVRAALAAPLLPEPLAPPPASREAKRFPLSSRSPVPPAQIA